MSASKHRTFGRPSSWKDPWHRSPADVDLGAPQFQGPKAFLLRALNQNLKCPKPWPIGLIASQSGTARKPFVMKSVRYR